LFIKGRILISLDKSAAVEGDLPPDGVSNKSSTCYESQEQERAHYDADVLVDLEVTVNELCRENQC
jgi:hypothetical protein